LIAVSTGHFTNDFYMNLIPPALFAFNASLGLTLAQQSMIAFIIITGGSLLQPVFGYFLDKIGKSSYLIYSIVWISLLMSISGFISNYYLLIIISGLGSLASSVYHPLGSSITVSLSKGSRGKSLSIFMTIGSFAATFTPMISIPVINQFGLKYLVFLMIPGFLVAFFLKYTGIEKIKCLFSEKRKAENNNLKNTSKHKVKWLSFIVFMCVIKVLFQRMIVVFGVQLMMMNGIGIITAGIVLSAHMFARSIGTLSGGYLSDRFGEKNVLILFNLLSFIIYALMIFSRGIWIIIGIILLGFIFNGTATANITITHHILPDNINLGTGTIMGLPGTIGSFLMLIFGKFADIYGLMEMAQLSACLGLIPLLISLYISKKYDFIAEKPVLVQT